MPSPHTLHSQHDTRMTTETYEYAGLALSIERGGPHSRASYIHREGWGLRSLCTAIRLSPLSAAHGYRPQRNQPDAYQQ
jgi:hypothetical protein